MQLLEKFTNYYYKLKLSIRKFFGKEFQDYLFIKRLSRNTEYIGQYHINDNDLMVGVNNYINKLTPDHNKELIKLIDDVTIRDSKNVINSNTLKIKYLNKDEVIIKCKCSVLKSRI